MSRGSNFLKKDHKKGSLLTTKKKKRQKDYESQKEILALLIFNNICRSSVENPCVEAKDC